jgi:orotate phosphoribosyltransferase
LLLDDTWTTGASAQSAALALRRAGARSIVTVVLGRHINPQFEPIWNTGPRPSHAFSIEKMPFGLQSCAVHSDALAS